MKHFNLLSNFRWFTTVILLITLSIGQAWGDTYSWTLPFSTTTNGIRESDESEDATFNIKTSKGADHGGTWTNQTKGSYFNVATGGYFILSIPINSSTTSFEIEADIYAWASKKYAAKNCTITYYTSKLSTPAAVCNGATTTSGCYSVDQTITLTASYKPASDGILYIKIAPDAGNVGFESLSVSTNAAASCSANPTIGAASLNGSFLLPLFFSFLVIYIMSKIVRCFYVCIALWVEILSNITSECVTAAMNTLGYLALRQPVLQRLAHVRLMAINGT